eukprot:m.307226 g.307226  ORF g.307226 m.307226 type:complete len:789 (+) comp42036_c0_seq1:223-2589(+)
MQRSTIRTPPRHRKRPRSDEFEPMDSPERFPSPESSSYHRRTVKQPRIVETRPRRRAPEEMDPLSPSSGPPSRPGSLRVANTAPDVDERTLKDAAFHRFKKYGHIQVFLSGRGSQREIIVEFDSELDARHAQRAEQNRSLFEYSMKISFQSEPVSRFHEDHRKYDNPSRGSGDSFGTKLYEQPASRTLFVGSLQHTVSEGELRDLFQSYGRIEGVDIKRGVGTTKATYAFVRFTTIEAAVKAKDAMQGFPIGRSRMRIGYGRGSPSTCLWVGNLARWVTSMELEQEFDRFGAISSIEFLPTDRCAYIKFDSFDAATAALTDMKGYDLGGQPLQVDFADENRMLKGPVIPSEHSPRHGHSRSNGSGSRYYDDGVRPYPREARSHVPSSSSHGYSHSSYDDHPDDYRTTLSRKRGYHDETTTTMGTTTYKKTRHLSMEEGSSYHDNGSRSVAPRQRSYSHHQDDYRSQDDHHSLGYRNDEKYRSDKVVLPRYPSGGGSSEKRRPRQSRSPLPTKSVQKSSSSSVPRKEYERERSRKEKDKERERERERGRERERERSREGKEEKSKKSSSKSKLSSKSRSSISTTQKASSTTSTAVASSAVKVESLSDLAKRFAVAWKGMLTIKNAAVSVRMHLIAGDPGLADSLLRGGQGQTISTTAFAVQQRLRLEQSKLEEVNRKVNTAGPSGHCMLLALPGPPQRGHSSTASVTEDTEASKALPLKNLIIYLKNREAAGVVMVSGPAQNDGKQMNGIMYIFPPCIFSQQHLCRVASSLPSEPAKEEHLLVIIVKET